MNQIPRKTYEIWALLIRGLNCSLNLICEAWETLQNKRFLNQNLIELWASPRRRKTSSLLAFLRPLLREATERSSSLKRWSKKRYWANVSEVLFQRQDAARKFLRRAKREIGLSLARSSDSEFLLDSCSENDSCAGAFGGSFTLKSERNVAFPIVRIASMPGEARESFVSWREREGSRALVFENDSGTKTLAG